MTESVTPDADFDTELSQLAKSIVQKAVLSTTPFDESVDAFKALTTYYALRLKHKQGDDDGDDSEFSFGKTSFVNEEQPNGGQSVRSRPRRSTS